MALVYQVSVHQKGVRSFQQTDSYRSIRTLASGSIVRDERGEILDRSGTVPVERRRPRFRDLHLASNIGCLQFMSASSWLCGFQRRAAGA